MGIYDNWDEFLEMAEEMRGTGVTDLRPEGTPWDSFVCWLEFGWCFVQVIAIIILLGLDFVIWKDVIEFVYKWGS